MTWLLRSSDRWLFVIVRMMKPLFNRSRRLNGCDRAFSSSV